MTRCLEDKTLFLLSEGEAGEKERFHLQNCRFCMERYHEIQRDLRVITQTLRQESPLPVVTSRAPIFSRLLPIAAGVLLAVALLWGESRLSRPELASEQRLSGDASQFLEQVSEAIFNGGNVDEVEPASSDSDLTSVQVALGESCSNECRGFFNDRFSPSTKSKVKAVDQPILTVKRRPVDPAMQRMVSDRAE